MAKARSARKRVQARGEDKRARIVAAAKEILARDGIEKASIREIAAEAGVARGLLHYYFETKEELLVAVAQAAAAELGQRFAELRASAAGADMADAAFAVHRERVTSDATWYRLRYDLFALALRKPAFRDEVADLLRGARRGIAAGLARSDAARSGAEDEALAAILAACFDGLALQKLVDPSFDLDAAYAELRRVAALAVRTEPR
jgi:AcrR family transcriptional regulator